MITFPSPGFQLPGPGLGQPASPDEISAREYTVTKDGVGLPPGSGTASEGAVLYQQLCEKCHGRAGRGASAEELVGGIGSLASGFPDKTIGSCWPYAPTLFDYIRRAMPIDAPLSLTDSQVYALSAYLLQLSRLIADSQRMDAQSLRRVIMPNRKGFLQTGP
ncbi:MAG: cytochrome c [Gammaproteobacteria bacterium]|nr:cytochrome c [Gammaproteobacteria bacterium]